MNATKKIVMTAMFAALCCVATMIIKIPSPFKGYINLGDCIVLLSGFMLSPLYGFMGSGLGSALADVLSGYVFYAPATFLIKGIMSIIAHFGMRLTKNKVGLTTSAIISGIFAEVIMIIGYYVFEGFLYGFGTSAVNIPANAIQGTAGLILGVILFKIFEKNKITF